MDGGDLLLGGLNVALAQEQLGELGAHHKGGSDFGLRVGIDVLLEPENGGIGFAAGEGEVGGSIDESGAVIAVERGAGMRGGDHIVDAIVAAIEGGEVHPRVGGACGERDGSLEVGFSGGVVFFRLGDAGLKGEGTGTVHGLKLGDDGFSVGDAATDDARGADVEFTEVGERVSVAGVELDSLLEFRVDLAGELIGGDEGDVFGFQTISAAEPEMEIAVIGGEMDRSLTVGDGGIPLLFLVVDAAAEIVRLGVIGVAGEGVAESAESFIGAAEIEILARWIDRRIDPPRRRGPERGERDKKDSGQQYQFPQNSP